MSLDRTFWNVTMTAGLVALGALAGCDGVPPDPTTVPASAHTLQRTGVAKWTLRPFTGDTLTLDGVDESGTQVSEIEIRSGKTEMTVRVDATVVPIVPGPHPLPPRTRGLLTGAADDLAAGAASGCRAAVVATIAASADCGAGAGPGCLTAPFQFCAAARACGAPSCER